MERGSRPRRAAARGLALASVLLGAAPMACAGSRAETDQEALAARASLGPLARRAVRVRVRLPAWRSRRSIEVRGTAAGALRLAVEGGKIRGAGTWASDEVLLAPAESGGALWIDGRPYRGRLHLRASPEGGFEIDDVLDLEEYVEDVVGGELAVWSALPAELEAQAIAARSYALSALAARARERRPAELYDDVRDQVYRGSFADLLGAGEKSGAGRREAAQRLRAAVRRTRGLVLTEGERVLDARFHAACGGRTAEGARVFPEADFRALAPVVCEPCQVEAARPRGAVLEAGAPGGLEWTWTAPREALDLLARSLGLGERLASLGADERDASGRWVRVVLRGEDGEARISFHELRARLGRGELASALVLATEPGRGEPLDAGLRFHGRGRGHGVGLCQLGARGYARRGWDAARILAHYYPGARVVAGS